jgi:hypothetical protein
MSPRVAQLQADIVRIIERQLEPLMVPSTKWTVIARQPDMDTADVLVTADSMDGIAGLLERSKARDAPTAAQSDYCTTCGGSGTVPGIGGVGPDAYNMDVHCHACGGTGDAAQAAPATAQPAADKPTAEQVEALADELRNTHGIQGDVEEVIGVVWQTARAALAAYDAAPDDDAKDAARYRWLRENVTFHNIDHDFDVEAANVPVLAQVSNRIWYHATDDVVSDTLDLLADAARSKP